MESTEATNRREERQLQARKSQRQILIAVLATVLAVLIVYRSGALKSIGFAPPSQSLIQASSPSASEVRPLDKEKFSLNYPGSWSELTPTELAALKGEFVAGIKRAKPAALMGVKIKAVEGDESSLKKLPDSLDKLMGKRFKNFKRLESSMRTINGRPMLKYAYKFDSENGLVIEQQQFITVKDKVAYYLLFHTKATDAPLIKDDIGSIVGSFVVK